jgi:hypothetical protein
MPKKHLDRTGWILDSHFRTSEIRRYFVDKVLVARDFIYRLGYAVASANVNGLLKATSSVPTIVCHILHVFGLDHLINLDTEFLLRTASTTGKGVQCSQDDGRRPAS